MRALIVVALLALILLCGCERRKCVRSHKENSTWLQMLDTGNGTLVPILHTVEVEVCDRYEKKEKAK